MTLELFEADAAAAREFALAEAERRELAAARLRELEADFTPRPVVREILSWYFDHVLRVVSHRPIDSSCLGCRIAGATHSCPDPSDYLLVQRSGVNRVLSRPTKVLRVLDVCAGAGVWASEMRRLMTMLGIPVHITAVELDEEREREYLPCHADEVVWGDWRAFAKRCDEDGRWFDLAVGNPAFRQARALKLDPSTSMPALLIQIAGAVILYMSQQGWTKTSAGFEVRRNYKPAYSVDVPGGVSHRAGGGADSVPYSATMWLGAIAGPHTGMMSVDMLDPFDGRSFSEGLRPGAEPIDWLRANEIPFLAP
jgi:hypothetical protein